MSIWTSEHDALLARVIGQFDYRANQIFENVTFAIAVMQWWCEHNPKGAVRNCSIEYEPACDRAEYYVVLKERFESLSQEDWQGESSALSEAISFALWRFCGGIELD